MLDVDTDALTRADVDALPGSTVVEFGASWCPHCHAARPLLSMALAGFDGIRHLIVEDGPGKRLGRSFGVKLWPTFVFLRDGKELARLVRPRDPDAIRQAIVEIA